MLSALLSDVVPYWRSRRAAAAAVLIVRRSVERVWTRVARQIVQMSEAEAIGYTRAHAANLIADAAESIFAEQGLGTRAREQALRDATQRIVEQVCERAQEAKTAIERRRAA